MDDLLLKYILPQKEIKYHRRGNKGVTSHLESSDGQTL